MSFIQVKPEIDETPLDDEEAGHLVMRLAESKAAAGMVLARRETGSTASDLVVVAADTIVVLDGELLGKPASRPEAVRVLQRLSGREHRVLTGLALGSSARAFVQVAETRVRFRHLTEDEIEGYAQTGEPLDKAGSYGIQGKGAIFVESIQGSYTNVAGLPLKELHLALTPFGINCLSLKQSRS